MTVLYSENFDGTTVGTLPSGWSAIRGTWSVQAADPVSGANTLAATTRTVGDFIVYTGQAVQTYQKLTVSEKITDTPNAGNGGSSSNDNYYAICTRVSATGAAGYLWLLRNSATAGALDVLCYKITAVNTYSQIGTTLVGAITGVAAGDVLILEAISNGSTHDFRVWKSTGSRPTSPTATQTDATTASGHIGFYYSKAASSSATVAGIDDLVYENATAVPNLSAATATPTASTTATVGCTTDTASGTLYAIVSTSATPPSVAQIRLGQDSSGSASLWSGNQAITSTGAKTFSATGLTNGATLYHYYQQRDGSSNDSAVLSGGSFVQTVPVVVAVTNTALYFSPFNWYSDGVGSMQSNNVKASSTYALCPVRGGYLKFRATVGASGSIQLNLDTTSLAALTADGCPQLAWSVNGAAFQRSTLTSGQTSLVLASGLSAGTYEVCVAFAGVYITHDGGTAQNYTTPNNAVKITAVQLSSGGSVSSTTIRPKTLLAYGDSITEGDLSNGGPRSASSQETAWVYAMILGAALNAEVGIVAYYGQTWSWFGSTWSNYYSGASRLVGGLLTPAPDYVTVNYGENDGNPGPASATVTSNLASLAAAAPTAKIALIIPFSGKARTNLSAATLPSNGVLVDLNRYEMTSGFTMWSYDGQHPNQRGHALLGGLLAYAISTTAPGGASRTVTVTLTTDGSTPAASLSGLKWRFFDNSQPNASLAPASTGAGATTNGSGVFSVAVTTTLASGGVGWLEVSDSDGTTTQTPMKAYSGPAQVT